MGKRILTFMVTLSALGAASQTLTLLPAHALGEAEYAIGVDAYKKKDFKKRLSSLDHPFKRVIKLLLPGSMQRILLMLRVSFYRHFKPTRSSLRLLKTVPKPPSLLKAWSHYEVNQGYQQQQVLLLPHL
jgi:hypothetical protein